MKRILPLIIILSLMIPASGAAAPVASQPEASVYAPNLSVTVPGGPTFWVHNVVRNDSVTIQLKNFPADGRYQVWITKIGNASGDGVMVGLVERSSKDFNVTFNIPNSLKRENLLSVKLRDNRDGSQAYVTFANQTGWSQGDPLSTASGNASSSQTNSNAPSHSVTVPNGGPSFWVHRVVRDDDITIKIQNFPKGGRYQVWITRIGNASDDGVVVGIIERSSDSFLASFKIPNKYKGQSLLSIKLRDNRDGSQAYTMFGNNTGWSTGDQLPLEPVDQSHTQTNGSSVGVFFGPNFWIHDVKSSIPPRFTLKITDFPIDNRYKVLVGDNDSSFQALFVGFIEHSSNLPFLLTFDLPSRLWDSEEIKVRVEHTQSGHSGSTAYSNEENWEVVDPAGFYDTAWINSVTASPYSGTTPFTNILNVVKDAEVTLQTFNFPADKDFVVTMGRLGTDGIGGFLVGTQNTGTGGSFVATYPIPAQLHGESYIALRLESASGHFAYDFFQNVDGYNNVSGTATVGTTNSDWTLPTNTYPQTVVNSVATDTSVTISGVNFTKNDSYKVLMGAIGTQGIGGINVATQVTDSSGTFTATYTIPASLVGSAQIAIRFESVNTPYYAYDFFFNN